MSSSGAFLSPLLSLKAGATVPLRCLYTALLYRLSLILDAPFISITRLHNPPACRNEVLGGGRPTGGLPHMIYSHTSKKSNRDGKTHDFLIHYVNDLVFGLCFHCPGSDPPYVCSGVPGRI